MTKNPDRHASRLAWLTLFTAGGTLICCALPITLVSLGMGAAVASVVSSVPLLISLSLHKVWVFGISACLLLLVGWLLYRPGRACPADPELAALCERTQRWNRRIFIISVTLWVIGFFAAYLALPLQVWLEA